MLFSLLKQRLNWSLPMKNWQTPWRPTSRSNGSGPFRYAFSPLEGETHRKNAVVIVSVKLSRSDLKSPSDGQRQPIPKMNPSDDETGGQEGCKCLIQEDRREDRGAGELAAQHWAGGRTYGRPATANFGDSLV